VTLYLGDCLERLRLMEANSVSAVVTDPPAGISFMNASWDHHKGGRAQWIAWMTEVMHEVSRVCRPGAHMLCWALPRTSHWTTTAIEDAGWEIRDVVTHLFGSGFPKSLNIARQIDGKDGRLGWQSPNSGKYGGAGNGSALPGTKRQPDIDVDIETDAARQWDGWGTALKPAAEHWILARKPLSEPTVAANVLKWSTGALNIDAARVGTDSTMRGNRAEMGYGGGNLAAAYTTGSSAGRWPANAIFSHVEGPDGCEEVGARKVKGGGGPAAVIRTSAGYEGPSLGKDSRAEGTLCTSHRDADGMETVSAWRCVPGCPVAELDRQSGVSKSAVRPASESGQIQHGWGLGSRQPQERGHCDTGTASRFFFVAKPSRAERERGLAAMARQRAGIMDDRPSGDFHQRLGNSENPVMRANIHPCVKSTALMRHLLTLVVPPGGIVLDPFAGSGSTGVAAAELGMEFIGIEREEAYYRIALARIEDAELRMEAERVLPLFAHAGIEL
jgi:hypothetical protein